MVLKLQSILNTAEILSPNKKAASEQDSKLDSLNES